MKSKRKRCSGPCGRLLNDDAFGWTRSGVSKRARCKRCVSDWHAAYSRRPASRARRKVLRARTRKAK